MKIALKLGQICSQPCDWSAVKVKKNALVLEPIDAACQKRNYGTKITVKGCQTSPVNAGQTCNSV